MNIVLSTKEKRTINGSGALSGAELVYLVSAIPDGTPDEEILKAVSAVSPVWQGYAPRVSAEISRRLNRDACEVIVLYRPGTASDDHPAPKEIKRAGDEIWTFSAGSTRERCYHALETTRLRVNGELSPDADTWINWNGGHGSDFRVSGTVKFMPAMREKCIHTFSAEQMTHSYKRRIMELIGSVNSGVFHAWDPGEVLFLDATQSPEFCNERGKWLTDVTFTFAIAAATSFRFENQTVSVPPWDVF